MFMRCVQSIIILIKLRAVQHLFGGRKKNIGLGLFFAFAAGFFFVFFLQRLKVSHYAKFTFVNALLSNCNVRVQPLMADGYYELSL